MSALRHAAYFTVLILAGPALAQPAPGSCGTTLRVERGDTLSRIAERCGVGERALLRTNPRIEGSSDLRVGMELQRSPGSADTADRLRSFAGDATQALSGAARDIGSTVDDLLDKNPDLNRRLRSLGGTLTQPDADARRAEVSVSPAQGPAGTEVTVTATGLPPDTAALIGGGAPGSAYETIQTVRTGRDGRLDVKVKVPEWAADLGRFGFVVSGPDGQWTARAKPFAVTGGRL
jgi:murein DD-endopeptidase MepM/ murein hydrolase activator NlpD